MKDVLSIKGLSKSFGTQKVIDNLDLPMPEGTVFGFIGQNGAGKTTTMKMALGLLEADRDTGQLPNRIINADFLQYNQTTKLIRYMISLK